MVFVHVRSFVEADILRVVWGEGSTWPSTTASVVMDSGHQPLRPAPRSVAQHGAGIGESDEPET